MKVFIWSVVFFFLSSLSVAQSSEINLFGVNKTLESLVWSVDETEVIGVGSYFVNNGKYFESTQYCYRWDANNGNLMDSINLSKLEKVTIDGNEYKGTLRTKYVDAQNNRIIIFGFDYQCCRNYTISKNFLFSIDITSGIVERKEISSKFDLFKICVNPTNPNEFTFINAMLHDSSQVMVYDYSQNKIKQTVYVGKRPFAPLEIHYSNDGKQLFLGCHIGVSKGGFQVYDLITNRKTHDITMGKELPIYFWQADNQLIVSTEYGKTICYDVNYVKKWELIAGINDIDFTGRYGLQVNCQYDDIQTFKYMDFQTQKSVQLKETYILQPRFNKLGTKTIAISLRNVNSREALETQQTLYQKTSSQPAAMIMQFNRP